MNSSHIIIEADKRVVFNSEPKNIWLNTYEIAALFNVFEQKIRKQIDTILKLGLLYEKDVKKGEEGLFQGKKGFVVLYNIDMITFLSYRIDSLEARTYRQHISKLLSRGSQSSSVVVVSSKMPPSSSCIQ